MDWNANMERHWEALILYIMGLIGLAGLYAEDEFAYDDRSFVHDLTIDDIRREMALRELEALVLRACANSPRRAYGYGWGWIGHPSQSRLESGWKRCVPLVLPGIPTHLPDNFNSINAVLPARFALRFRPGKMRSRDSP